MNAPAAPPEHSAESLLRLIFDHTTEGISVFDGAQRLQAWNPQFLALTRLDPATVHRGAPLQDLVLALARAGEFGDVDVDAEVQRRMQLLSLGASSVTERMRPDGRTLELRRSPTPGGGFVMLYADITERKSAAAAMADQQRMRSLLIEATEQGIWFIDNALCTTDANPAMCRMLGLALPQMLGRTIYDFVDPANERIFREHVTRRSEGQAEAYEIALMRADGTQVHCYNNATPMFDAAGVKVGAVGMFSDITPLKRAEQQIRHTGELLAQQSRVLEVTLDNLSQGVLSVGADGRANAYNRRFLDLVQLPLALMQTRPTVQALTAYQREQDDFGERLECLDATGREGLRRFLDGDLSALNPSYRRTRRDGMVLEVHTHTADDGSMVRTYTDVYEFALPGGDLEAGLATEPVVSPLPSTRQGEGLAYSRDGRSLLLSTEGRGSPVHRVTARAQAPSPQAPSPRATARDFPDSSSISQTTATTACGSGPFFPDP